MELKTRPENHTTFPAITTNFQPYLDLLVLSSELTQIITIVNFSVIGTCIAAMGIFANVINVVVFVRQGFKDTINVSLFTLALADMASLMFLAWIGVCFNPFLKRHSLTFDPIQIVYLTGGQSRLYFTRVVGWITSVVAIERCFCVLKPMQVKLVFTRNRIVVVLILIFLASFMTMVPVYYTTRLSWKFDSTRNSSIVGLTFIENRHKIDRVSFALGVSVTISAFVIVTSCTFILGWSLVKQSRWRAESMVEKSLTADDEDQKSGIPRKKARTELSTRDRQAVRTVTFIAAMFVVCFFPYVLNLSLMSIFPEYNKHRRYENLYLVVWSFAQMAEGFCSSANIFIYYRTSTKYKDTLIKLVHFTEC